MTREAPAESEGARAVRKFMGVMTPDQMAQREKTENSEPAQEAPEAEQADAALERELREQISRIDAFPEASYEQRLARLGIDLEEAAKIVDSILTHGFYEREFPLSRKHSVTLRTRGVEDQERLQESVENRVPRYAITVNEITARHNLAASLAELNGQRYAPNEFKKAYAAVGKLPLPVFNALIERLAKFDAIMFTVLSEGAAENF